MMSIDWFDIVVEGLCAIGWDTGGSSSGTQPRRQSLSARLNQWLGENPHATGQQLKEHIQSLNQIKNISDSSAEALIYALNNGAEPADFKNLHQQLLRYDSLKELAKSHPSPESLHQAIAGNGALTQFQQYFRNEPTCTEMFINSISELKEQLKDTGFDLSELEAMQEKLAAQEKPGVQNAVKMLLLNLGGAPDTITIISDHLHHIEEGTHERHMKELFENNLKKAAENAEKGMSAGSKLAIFGGGAALVGTLGYWAFKNKQEKAQLQEHSETPSLMAAR